MNYLKYLQQAGVDKELIPDALAYFEQCSSKYKEVEVAKHKLTAWFVVGKLLLQGKVPFESEHLPKQYKNYDNDVSINGDRGEWLWENNQEGTCQPNEKGELWCVSSIGLERIPSFSRRRAGKLGGVRFKRINVNSPAWELDDPCASAQSAAEWAAANQGRMYDWQLIFGFLAWFIPNKKSRVMCSEACAEMLGLRDAHRFDPCTLQAVVKAMKVWKC